MTEECWIDAHRAESRELDADTMHRDFERECYKRADREAWDALNSGDLSALGEMMNENRSGK